jgi:hypothetical protein
VPATLRGLSVKTLIQIKPQMAPDDYIENPEVT